MRGGQHRNPVAHGGQGPRAEFGLEPGGHQRLVDGRRQLPGQRTLGRSTHQMVDRKLQHRGFGHWERQRGAVARHVPAGPVAQGGGVAAGGVRRGRFGQQFPDGIGGLLGQLFRQQRGRGRCQEGR